MNMINFKLNKPTRSAFVIKVVLILFITVFSSCEEDVLDREPLNRFSENAVWQDEALIKAFVGNTYRTVPTGFYVGQALMLSTLSDEANARNNFGYELINQGNLDPSNMFPLDYWTEDGDKSYYKVITKCNLFLDEIDAAPIDPESKNLLIGEIKFLRAYSYFRLISFYGGVPLITEPFTLEDDFQINSNTYNEVMDFILIELDEAANLLPTNYGPANKGKITKGAAMALKSRALLYAASPLNNPDNNMEKWEKAANAAKAIIDLNIYELFPDYKTLFLEEEQYNSEIIWSRPFNNLIDPEEIIVRLELILYPNGNRGWGQVNPLENLVEQYETLNGELPNEDSSYDPQNPYINRDPRFYATILYNGAPFLGREIETFLPGGLDTGEGPTTPWNATTTGYYLRKFVDESITAPTYFVQEGNTPWIFIRYAEILLNYAEAKFMLGDEVTAREYINKVRSRPSVDMPDVTDSGDLLWAKLVNERRIELAFEEHRYFDVRRWKIAPQVLNENAKKVNILRDDAGNLTYSVEEFQERIFYERNYWVPIPQSEIEKNPKLNQNPGY